ncbi:MAG: hypothetical protein OXF23_02740, partial [Candidatus Dadabacteria bacterium]|nr:hypothetical protein [Candidatus Dadabacteria bacterium]
QDDGDDTNGVTPLPQNNYLHVSLKDGESAIWDNTNGDNGTANPTFEEDKLLDDISGIENVVGATGLNHLVGDDKDNVLTVPGAGVDGDKIKGMGGDDTIDAGGNPADNDLVDGGAGSDTLVVGANYPLPAPAGPEATIGVRGIENLKVRLPGDATTGITLTGDAGPNTLTGGPAADTLIGGKGNDTLDGGPGSGDAESDETNTLTGNDPTDATDDGADTLIIRKGTTATISDFSGKAKGNDGDKIYLKGFDKAKDKLTILTDSQEITQIQVNGVTVVTLGSADNLPPRIDVEGQVMFKD